MVDPEQAVDQINTAFGHHPGHRALHAKGGFYVGTFTATPAASALCRAEHLSGRPTPVRVRWSNGGGNPTVPDKAPDVRGMAVSFRLSDGSATDLLGQTAPRFPVRTPEGFLELVAAARKPYLMPVFLLRHPDALGPLLAGARAKATASPFSYAEVSYFPIHAYRWLAADGSSTWVRYRFTPTGGKDQRPAGVYVGQDRLGEEIAARLATAPVGFLVEVQTAGPGDDPDDPMSVWSSDWWVAGDLQVTGPDPDRETNGEVVVFDPTRVVDGIELSDDPILLFRPKVYSASVARRVD